MPIQCGLQIAQFDTTDILVCGILVHLEKGRIRKQRAECYATNHTHRLDAVLQSEGMSSGRQIFAGW